jgi:hypothetical protein
VHLLTREAMREYANRLSDGGALLVHISNRVFDLEPVLAGTAQDLGWKAVLGEGGAGPGAQTSTWILLTESDELPAKLGDLPRWRPVPPDDSLTWTDDYSSVLSVLK